MDATRFVTVSIAIIFVIFWIILFIVFAYLLFLIIKALRKYVNTKDIREEKKIIRKSLGETLKENRIRCKMTQEFVSEALGVSRQAVSKWENGSSDPSTSNLLSLAELYEVSSEELLKSTNTNYRKQKDES